MVSTLTKLKSDLSSCNICRTRFRKTQTEHSPRPIVWFGPKAKILIAGQAPGLRVHESGRPFWDRSGDRLRDWMGIEADTFYDTSRVAVVPMAFCFPGYDTKGSDLAPPAICAETWRDHVLVGLKNIKLTLTIGGYAQKWHLGTRLGVTETVRRWSDYAPETIPLPHPSWRNTGWIKRNPWFESELLPVLREKVQEALSS